MYTITIVRLGKSICPDFPYIHMLGQQTWTGTGFSIASGIISNILIQRVQLHYVFERETPALLILYLRWQTRVWLRDTNTLTSSVPSSSQSTEPMFESCAATSILRHICSLYVAPDHSAVWMCTWLKTVVDICEQIVFVH